VRSGYLAYLRLGQRPQSWLHSLGEPANDQLSGSNLRDALPVPGNLVEGRSF
jgi:hypothetical protein